jgi:hypothetical protein
MKLAREIAETLYKLMAPDPASNAASIDRIPCMALHAGSMEAVISEKLEPVREALVCAWNAGLIAKEALDMLSEEES